jgi:hypothetical protein
VGGLHVYEVSESSNMIEVHRDLLQESMWKRRVGYVMWLPNFTWTGCVP